MKDLSVVIISRNEEDHIESTIRAAREVSNDIVLIDAHSEDNTRPLAASAGARVFLREWEGYGVAKNFGNAQAHNNWILSLDADEVMDAELIENIKELDVQQETVYSIYIKTNFCGKWMRFSELKPGWKKRLFDRRYVQWNNDELHENLIVPRGYEIRKIKGSVMHFSYKDSEELERKSALYARLAALRLYRNNARPTFFKKTLAPLFRFIKSYIIQLGFMEGSHGWTISRTSYLHAKKRYEILEKLRKGNGKKI